MIRVLPAFCIVLLSTAAWAGDNAGAAIVERLDGEAARLFAQVLHDRARSVETCELEASWDRYPVNYDTIQKAFGVTIYATFVQPDDVADPSEVIGGSAAPATAFCDDDTFKRHLEQRHEDWSKSHFNDDKPSGFVVPRTAYTFPIFDQGLTHAVLMELSTGYNERFEANGIRERGRLSGGGSALVYRKEAGRWRKIDEEDYYDLD